MLAADFVQHVDDVTARMSPLDVFDVIRAFVLGNASVRIVGNNEKERAKFVEQDRIPILFQPQAVFDFGSGFVQAGFVVE